MKSRTVLGALIALTTAAILTLSALWTSFVLIVSLSALLICIYAEIMSWSSWRNEALTHTSALALIFSAFMLLLIIGGGIALAFLGWRSIRLATGIFALAFITDTAALFAGVLLSDSPILGKRDRPLLKFAPSKTLAGFLGALLIGLTTTFGLCGFGFLPLDPIVILSPVVIVLADILGSGFKRIYGIKDSGQILAEYRRAYKPRETSRDRESFSSRLWRAMLPHGGFLDRFGSVLLLAAFISLFTKWGALP
ncbi:phosphatidate cytidylyltransferase [Candidatus Saccharibacteria bacterium]|nr:phosphatidate cytidylyltransferase [Candidatus Saccharibacteria bacterium]